MKVPATERRAEEGRGQVALAPGRDADGHVRGIVSRLARSIGPERFDRYFRAGTRLRFDPGEPGAPAPAGADACGKLEVRVENAVVAGVMSRRFAQALREAARGETGRDVEVEITVDPGASLFAGENAAATEAVSSGHAERGARGELNGAAPISAPAAPRTQRYRLEEFVVGASNRLAYTAALRLAEEAPAGRSSGELPFSTLVLHGACGVGKTHLLQGVAARFKERHEGAVVRCTTGEQFMNEFVAAIRTQSVEKFRRTYRRLDLLCIDDVHFLADKKATQEELLHTFDAIDLSGARVVIACDEHPREVKRLSDALISRFVSGLVARIDPPDPALREQLARVLAARRGLSLDDAAAKALADPAVSGSSIRDLEGAATRLDAVVRLLPDVRPNGGDGRVGLIAVERALGGLPGGAAGRNGSAASTGKPAKPIRIDSIIEHVCATLRVERNDLFGKGRHKRVVLARALITHLARSLTTLSFPDIARALGRPNHSTVITAYQRLAKQLESPEPALDDGSMPSTVGELVRRLSEDVRRAR